MKLERESVSCGGAGRDTAARRVLLVEHGCPCRGVSGWQGWGSGRTNSQPSEHEPVRPANPAEPPVFQPRACLRHGCPSSQAPGCSRKPQLEFSHLFLLAPVWGSELRPADCPSSQPVSAHPDPWPPCLTPDCLGHLSMGIPVGPAETLWCWYSSSRVSIHPPSLGSGCPCPSACPEHRGAPGVLSEGLGR